jgi:hypothetical protein
VKTPQCKVHDAVITVRDKKVGGIPVKYDKRGSSVINERDARVPRCQGGKKTKKKESLNASFTQKERK